VESGVAVDDIDLKSDQDWLREAQCLLDMPLLSTKLAVKDPTSSVKALKGSFCFGGSSQEAAASKAKNLGTMSINSLALGGAGSGGGLGLNAPGFGAKVKHFAGAAPAGKKSLEVNPEVTEAWMRVVDDADPLMWIYCAYSSDGKNLELAQTGTGGLSEFKAALGETIAWGGFRCYGVDQRGNLECKRPKFILVQHKPETAPAMKKAKQGSHKGEVKAALNGAHLDVTVENLDDLEEQRLIEKLQAATGAHKPNGYQFEEGIVLEADFYELGIGKNCKGESSSRN